MTLVYCPHFLLKSGERLQLVLTKRRIPPYIGAIGGYLHLFGPEGGCLPALSWREGVSSDFWPSALAFPKLRISSGVRKSPDYEFAKEKLRCVYSLPVLQDLLDLQSFRS